MELVSRRSWLIFLLSGVGTIYPAFGQTQEPSVGAKVVLKEQTPLRLGGRWAHCRRSSCERTESSVAEGVAWRSIPVRDPRQ
jgi:hypothetical protein